MVKRESNVVKVVNQQGPMGWILFMAWIGAFLYFFNLDPTFLGFFVAIFKAIVWPAYVLYEVLGLLGIR